MAREGYTLDEVNSAVKQANHFLPDYARVSQWILASEAFTPANGQLTANGRLRREALYADYRSELESLYQEETHEIF